MSGKFGVSHFAKHRVIMNVSSDLVCSTTEYADGDVVGTGGAFILKGVVEGERVASVIRTVQINNRSSDAKLFDLFLFDDALSSDSTITDNSALALALADRNKMLGVIPFDSDSVKTHGLNQIANADLVIFPGVQDVYGVLVAKEAMTLEPADLRVRLLVECD